MLDEFYSLTDRLGVSVQINISVENTDVRAEWVRGMDWNHFERVVGIHKQRANEMVVKVTENFLCVSNLPEFVAWGTDAGFDSLGLWNCESTATANQCIAHELQNLYKDCPA